jgi:hypothetical protein
LPKKQKEIGKDQLKIEKNTQTKLENKYMKGEAKQKRVILFEKQNLIQEERDLNQLLYLSKQGLDLERISEEMEHLSVNELILMSVHLCMAGKMKKLLLSWDV